MRRRGDTTTIIGIDAHYRTCTYVAKASKGTRLGDGTIPSTRLALTNLAETYPGATAVIEASSVHQWIYDHLMENGLLVYACHPANIKQLLGKKKDEVDAEFLADAHLLGVLPPSWVPPHEIRDLRQLVRYRATLLQDRTRYKNRIHGILKRRGQHADSTTVPIERTNLFTKAGKKRLLELKDAQITSILALIEATEEELKKTTKTVQKEAEQRESTRNLMSIPGFGPTVALTIFAELGDINRFTESGQVASYLGLVPSLSQSGDTTHHGHITKRGSELARWVLGQAAWQHARFAPDSSLTRSFRRVAERRGNKIAITALARKLAVVSYWLLKENREFRING